VSAIDSLIFSKIKSDLFPVLSAKDQFDLEEKKRIAKEHIERLMKLTDKEMEYMEMFIKKQYKPELLLRMPRFWNAFIIILWHCGNVNNEDKFLKLTGQ